jgi:hypothetical protein
MINANEIRIGNWVEYGGETLSVGGISESVATLYPKPPVVNICYVLVPAEVSYDEINPIPLSPEILEKAGFKWSNSINHWIITWGINGVHFIKFDEYYDKFSFQLGQAHYKVLDYVHQLQNLYFALTGEELNIEL